MEEYGIRFESIDGDSDTIAVTTAMTTAALLPFNESNEGKAKTQQ